MNFFIYCFFRCTIFIFRITPFWLLFLYSDLLYFLLFYVVRYRKKVVFDNLRYAFPDLSDKEIEATAKRFFHHLSDITFESIKGYSLGNKEVLKRYSIANPEILDNYFKEGRNVICLASHYGNWEWGILSVALQLKHSMYSLYKPLSNTYLEKFMIKRRAVSGMNLVSIYDTRASFESVKPKPSGYIMAADQSPSNIEKAIWVRFLDRETACLHGAEYYARKYNLPVLYFDVRKTKRGFYELYIREILSNPADVENGTVTKVYMNALEQSIRKQPEFWLWSHRRWKHRR